MKSINIIEFSNSLQNKVDELFTMLESWWLTDSPLSKLVGGILELESGGMLHTLTVRLVTYILAGVLILYLLIKSSLGNSKIV